MRFVAVALLLFACGAVAGASSPYAAAGAERPLVLGTSAGACAAAHTASAMLLDVSDSGICTVTVPVVTAPKSSGAEQGGALHLRFACAAHPAGAPLPARLEGPAEGLWAALHTAAAGNSNGNTTAVCGLTAQAGEPRTPPGARQRPEPLPAYGYELEGVPCAALTPAAARAAAVAQQSGGRAGGGAPAGVAYGIMLAPALPSPAQTEPLPASTAPQRCHLVVTGAGRAYMHRSRSTFACRLVGDPSARLAKAAAVAC